MQRPSQVMPSRRRTAHCPSQSHSCTFSTCTDSCGSRWLVSPKVICYSSNVPEAITFLQILPLFARIPTSGRAGPPLPALGPIIWSIHCWVTITGRRQNKGSSKAVRADTPNELGSFADITQRLGSPSTIRVSACMRSFLACHAGTLRLYSLPLVVCSESIGVAG
jgi:hypothetical protein